MLEVRFFETNIPRDQQAGVTSCLREGSFNSCSPALDILNFLALLTHTSRLQEFMTLLRKMQRHTSSRLLGIGACFPDRTRFADLFGKEDLGGRHSLRIWLRYQVLLCCPCGQVTLCCCQSMWNCSTSNAPGVAYIGKVSLRICSSASRAGPNALPLLGI